MPTPSTRTPVRIARGSYSNLNSSLSDLQDGEIVYAEDQDKLYIKEGSSLVVLTTPSASPTFTGDVTINAQGDLRLADSNSSNYVGFQSPATVSSNVVWTLPDADGSANQYLKTDGSGALSWGTDSATDSTKLPLAGGTMSGDINLGTNDITNGGTITGTFSGNLTGNVTGNASGTAATVTGAAQSAITSLGTLTGLTVNGDATLTGANANVLWDTSADALKFADSVKARFGTGNDLSIYHDGSNSYIDEGGTGHLYIRNGTDNAVVCETDGAVQLMHNNLQKIQTTSSGVDVTGTAVVDGITIDGAYEQVAEAVGALEIDCSTGNYFTKTISGNSTFTFANPAASGSVTAFTLELTHSSGTITWPSSVVWNGGVGKTAPTVTAGKTHLFMFVTDDAGSTYRGSALVDYDNAA